MAIDNINLKKSALVLIDLQNGIVAMPTAPRTSAEVISAASKVADSFRENGGTVVLVRVKTAPSEALKTLVDQPRAASGELPENWSTIVPEIGPKDGDLVVTKRNWGAFYGTDLDLILRRRGIDTIVLGGISTNMGVESTARNAHEHNYNVIFIEDACAAMDGNDHKFAFERIFPRIGRVSNSQEIISKL
jgi:nicotinamidase-related amidase